MPKAIFLSVCVPAYNEAVTLKAAVEELVSALAPVVGRLEVIIVNDGSRDDTGKIADALAAADGRVRVVHHPVNLGFGLTYRDGVKAATGDFFTWFPGDHENDAGELVASIPHVKPGVIVTSQHVATDPRPWYRRIPSRWYTRVMNALFGLKVRYYNGLSIYPTADLKAVKLFAEGFAVQAEGLVKVARRGLPIVELEYPIKQRVAGKSALTSWKSLRQALRDALRIARG